MSDLGNRAKKLFWDVLDQSGDPEAFINQACGDDTELRDRVRVLLNAHQEAGDFLAPSNVDATIDSGPTPFEVTQSISSAELKPSDDIGPYRLMEQIGEGGMGSVWVAKQSEPIKRKVAIKLIKAGMDSQQVLARFEAERQALAIMDHPNIARVFDGGMTEHQRPYFAMEYVKGVPLTEYCDQAKLSVKERLELFLPVCDAVQHAHQKGIIHRDLKPSNILISLDDAGKPVPKVIDFGLAKAMHHSLTEQTLFTAQGMMVGTPLYMSPEQAQHDNLDIDTRTDVYALGVILYELLTGSTPLEKAQMKEAAYNEVLRLIKEFDPPKPSSRLSSSESLPSVAAQRSIEPAQLTRNVSGDLDWVVMKSLDKERSRRYETASGMAEDIRRHLSDEPVSAGPPSARYRMRKFIKRNRASVVAVGAIALALLLGAMGTTAGMLWALSEKSAAVAARQAIEAERDAKDRARKDAETAQGKAEQAEYAALDAYRASTDYAITHLIGSKPILGPLEKTYLENVLKRWQAFADRQGDDERSMTVRAEGHARVAAIWEKLGRNDQSRDEYIAAREILRRLVEQFPAAPRHRAQLAQTRIRLGILLGHLGRPEDSSRELQAARELAKALVAQFPAEPEYLSLMASAHNELGTMFFEGSQNDNAEAEFRASRTILQSLRDVRGVEREYLRSLFLNHHNLGRVLDDFGDEKAQAEFRKAIQLQQTLTEEFPQMPRYREDLAMAHNSLARSFRRIGEHQLALDQFLAARKIRKKLVEQFPAVPQYHDGLANTHNNIGITFQRLADNVQARKAYEDGREIHRQLVEQFPEVPEYRFRLAATQNNLGSLLDKLGELPEAISEYRIGRDIYIKLVEEHSNVRRYRQYLANSHFHIGSLLSRLEDDEESLLEFQAALDIQRALVEQFPNVPDHWKELASTQNGLGIRHLSASRWDKAKAAYERSIGIQERLVEKFPDVPEYEINLGGSCCNYGLLNLSRDNPDESLEWFNRAVKTLQRVHEREPRDVTAKSFLRNSYIARANAYTLLEDVATASEDWRRGLELCPPWERPVFLMQAGKFTEGVAEVVRLTESNEDAQSSSSWSAEQLFEFACVCAMGSAYVKSKKQEYGDLAMKLLQRAVETGMANPSRIADTPFLKALQKRDDFKKLLSELERINKKTNAKTRK